MEKQYPFGNGAVKWVSTDWLEDHLSDRDLMLLDVQPDVHDYLQEHIPGAVYMNEEFPCVARKGIPALLAPPEAIQPYLRHLGLNSEIPVVVYTGTGSFTRRGDGFGHAIAAYCLVRFGHEKVYILDGGIDRWKTERKPLAQEFPEVEKSDFSCHVRTDYFIEYNEFRAVCDTGSALILDTRPAGYYEGQGPWIQPGHIPGAVNLIRGALTEPETPWRVKPDVEIQAAINRIHAGPDRMIICSGGTLREASEAFIILRFYLDYPNVRLYEGGFSEWTAYPGNPTVTGKAPYDVKTAPESHAAFSGRIE